MCYARRQRSSWARIKLSKILYHFTFRCNNLFSSFCSSFTFCLSSISQFELFEFTSHFCVCFVLLSSLFNFQWPFRLRSRSVFCLRSRGDLTIISHCLPFVNTFFKTFLSFFKLFPQDPLGRQLVYSITFFLSCQGVFKSFLKKFFRHIFSVKKGLPNIKYNRTRKEIRICR